MRHRFSEVKFCYFGFCSFWVPGVAIGSQKNVSEPRVPLDRRALLREFALPPLAADKLRPLRFQRTSQNFSQLHLTTGIELQTSAIQSGETTEQCLKLHPTTTCHLSAPCGTELILRTAGVDGDSLWDWLEPSRMCKCMFGSTAPLHTREGSF